MEGLVKNTLMFRFPNGTPGPSVVEMARFAKAFDADHFTMESVYKISEEKCLCIKFINEKSMKEALMQNPENHVFEYSNGEKVEIKMSVAGGCSKYIRIFDLPPEVPDQEIATVLSKFGVVRRMVREKFPPQMELDLTTGVRGVHIEIKKEIPATLFFLNRRGRVYYDGVKHKCYLCKNEGHLKADCPRNPANQNIKEIAVANGEPKKIFTGTPVIPPSSSGKNSYAAKLTNKPIAHKETEELKMTVLVPAAKASVGGKCDAESPRSSISGTVAAEDNTIVPVDKAVGEGDDKLESEGLTDLDMEVDESVLANKRTHESSSTEDDGCSRVTRNRKHKKENDTLQTIASEPVLPKGSGKSKTKK